MLLETRSEAEAEMARAALRVALPGRSTDAFDVRRVNPADSLEAVTAGESSGHFAGPIHVLI